MDRLAKKAKTVKNLGIAGIVLLPIAIVLLILSTALVTVSPTLLLVCFVLGILSAIAVGPICLASSIMILATHWENQELDNSKLQWGLLGIFLIPGIAAIIFGCKACNEYASN